MFAGIMSTTPNVHKITFTAFNVFEDFAINRLDLVTTPVPEPSTYLVGALLALVFGVQGVRSLRSRKQVV